MLCHIQTWHLFLSCPSFAVKSGISFRSSISCQSLTLTGTTCCNLFQWLVTFRFVLKFTYLLQSVFISSSFSCQAFMLTGFHLFHWQVEQSVCSYLSPLQTFPCFCSSVSAGFARSLLLSAIWVSREAGSLSPSVFSLSTQLLALAYRDIR